VGVPHDNLSETLFTRLIFGICIEKFGIDVDRPDLAHHFRNLRLELRLLGLVLVADCMIPLVVWKEFGCWNHPPFFRRERESLSMGDRKADMIPLVAE
jgi:hypothetical protein